MIASAGYKLQRERNSYPIALINAVIPAQAGIHRGGENVYPREIEEFLYTHPEISAVQVYGVPDENYGEKVAAAVQMRQGSELTAEEVIGYCQENIARFKVPEYVDFVEEYPMTASGKIQKYKLREAAVERHNLKGATVDSA